jgi:bifunctional non-homologous end joining protein LigD
VGKKRKSDEGRLRAYREKRSADRTPEPFSGAGERPRLFVVQKHAATRLHYDLRLEIRGALHSWAVPRGPSLDPQVKRLAVEVEDHPLEYADFEGLIPEGNYGAGAVIVWDRGQWAPVDDPVEGLERGKLLFDLHGYKLRGRWTLFRTKGKPNEWLLMKKPDGHANPEAEPAEESILSGLTVEDLRDGTDPAKELRRRLRRLDAPRRRVDVLSLSPMLAQPRERAFSRPGWLFELKYDGYRLLAARGEAGPRLRYRRGTDVTARFPELAAAVDRLPFADLVLDGELVVLDEGGRPSFQRLQQRVQQTLPTSVQRATIELPATLFAFDLLAAEGHDLRGLPLLKRKELLRRILPRAGPLRYADHIETDGEAMFEEVRSMRLEGIVAKKIDAPYRPGRGADWLKIRADRVADFVVVGYSPARGSRTGFGALHLAQWDAGALTYAGRVGSGFSGTQLDELKTQLDATRRPDPPCSGQLPADAGQTWVEPETVCEVRYKEWTAEKLLRQPVFLRIRDDKPLEECIREDPSSAPAEPEDEPQAESTIEAGPKPKTVSFTNLTKVFWPAEGFTKGDLIEYHRAVSDWMLPYLRDRPLVMTRYPDGIEGKNFFQKDAPGFVPDWVRTETMWSEHAQREIRYFIADDVETLLYIVNLGTIPLHLWSSRVSALQHPDWCILDLDPKKAPFDHVVTIARRIRLLCNEIGLECFVKTSGSTGLHVLLPLGGLCTYEHSRSLGELLARVVVSELPEIATTTRTPAARGERVYVDFLQNGHGKLLVGPFSVRPLPGAPVSTPLRWSEVKRGLDIRRFTIRNVPARLRRMKGDPLSAVLTMQPDLAAVLGRFSERLDERAG